MLADHVCIRESLRYATKCAMLIEHHQKIGNIVIYGTSTCSTWQTYNLVSNLYLPVTCFMKATISDDHLERNEQGLPDGDGDTGEPP